MREFGEPANRELDRQIRDEAHALFLQLPVRSEVLGAAVAMDDAEELVVLRAAEIKFEDGQKFRLSETTDAARPPFEWLMEISSDMGESEYFKHYLIRQDDVVLAQRKLLTPIDDAEAKLILDDFANVRTAMQELEAIS